MVFQSDQQADQALPVSIDGIEFARDGLRLAASVEVSALPRLAEDLADSAGRLACIVAGHRDGEGKCWLDISVSGQLKLRCQRCLEMLSHPLDVTARLLLVPPGEPWPEDEMAEDGFDAVVAEKDMALLPLIEEEVLLALPLVPRHPSCKPPAPMHDEREPSPFAALAQFKKGV